ncbi:MAG: MarR family EPS-associated transcriptional regulator [Candidatus Omnitrophica bacterium]|nr:MarR family EPS-associated transcriptional regulator [Candidatus Omnitrophota bacterium]
MNKKYDILNSEKVLLILKEIESNPQVTQRYLSKRCSISLGKVNYLINALLCKGILKVQNFKNSKSKIAYMYLFTPYGVKTKFDLTRRFLEFKIQEYAKLKEEIENFKKEVGSPMAVNVCDGGVDVE